MIEAKVERVARAICAARGLGPDTLHQNMHEPPECPIDEERAGYQGVRMTFHRGWRRHVHLPRAAIEAYENP